MNTISWVVAVLGLGLGLFAVRRILKLSAAVEQLKREKYYIDSRLKRVPEEIAAVVEPLRHQLATVTEGGTVPRELILQGRLFMDVSAEEARTIIEKEGRVPGKVTVLDVRTPREYAVRRIPGAKLVPFEDLDKRYETEIPMEGEKIFVYCMGGERSRSACDFLSRRGYANLYNVREGIQGWQGPTEGDGEVQLLQIEPLRTKSSG